MKRGIDVLARRDMQTRFAGSILRDALWRAMRIKASVGEQYYPDRKEFWLGRAFHIVLFSDSYATVRKVSLALRGRSKKKAHPGMGR
jgi:hypothetical protein